MTGVQTCALPICFYELRVRNAPGTPLATAPSATPGAPLLLLAANLANAAESDIAPSAELKIGQQTLQAPEAFAVTRSQKLWIYIVLLAGLLIAIEWITYHRRITV